MGALRRLKTGGQLVGIHAFIRRAADVRGPVPPRHEPSLARQRLPVDRCGATATPRSTAVGLVTADGQIIVPALALRTLDGARLDRDATARYAERAERTWADAFILSGSTTRGDQLRGDERAELLDLWTHAVGAERLVACCWCADDITEAARRAITPMVVMHSARNQQQALSLLAGLPAGAYVYSHPKYGSTLFDATLATAARQRAILPAGAKLSKITTDDIAIIRHAAGARWTLWDASARHISASLAAGASGIVVTPLSHLPAPFPDRCHSVLQPAIDAVQQQLDRLPSRAERRQLLHRLARQSSVRPVRQTRLSMP